VCCSHRAAACRFCLLFLRRESREVPRSLRHCDPTYWPSQSLWLGTASTTRGGQINADPGGAPSVRFCSGPLVCLWLGLSHERKSEVVLPSSTVGNPAVTHLGGIVLRLNSTPSELPSIGSANDEESQLSRPAMLAVKKICCRKHYSSRFASGILATHDEGSTPETQCVPFRQTSRQRLMALDRSRYPNTLPLNQGSF